MKPKPPCPACGQPPASMIEDGYSIDLTPWWRYYAQKFSPFKRRRRMAPMEDVVPLIDAVSFAVYILNEDPQGNRAKMRQTLRDFLSKHPLP